MLVRIRHFLFLIAIILLTGLSGGILGSCFGRLTVFATSFHKTAPWVIYTLPLIAVFITYVYEKICPAANLGSNNIIEGINHDGTIPIKILPLIFFSAIASHFCGASVGRVGSTIQMGGCLGEAYFRAFKLNFFERRILIICGISSVLSAMFQTPFMAACLACEIACIGKFHFEAFPPALAVGFLGKVIGAQLGIAKANFVVKNYPIITKELLFYVIAFAALAGLLAALYYAFIKDIAYVFTGAIKNIYLRSFIISLIILVIIRFMGYDYCGMGTGVIVRAFEGDVPSISFLIKLLLTALCIAAGLKGGQVYPALFIGATFGATFSSLIGDSSGLFSALGICAMFCGITNCPIATLLLCLELFGSRGAVFFIITILISFFTSLRGGIYPAQTYLLKI